MVFNNEKYKIWNWKSPVILHWMINPILVINELVLGQTMPKVMLIERGGETPYFQRALVPCPHCKTMHNGMNWSLQNKTIFKNWFGYYCDHCCQIIPVQRNLTSLVVLAVTYPLWGWYRSALKRRWLECQPDRYQNITLQIPEKWNTTSYWLRFGLGWALFMYIIMTFLFPLFSHEPITIKKMLIGIPVWLLGGLGYGFIMKLWMNIKRRSAKRNSGTK